MAAGPTPFLPAPRPVCPSTDCRFDRTALRDPPEADSCGDRPVVTIPPELVADFSFEANKAGGELDFSEPVATPLERLVIRTSMAGMNVGRIGNASPRHLEIDTSMAGAMLDLRGDWRNDSDIEIQTSMGGVNVRLPRDVHLVGVPGRLGSATPSDETDPRPTLRFDVRGEVEFN